MEYQCDPSNLWLATCRKTQHPLLREKPRLRGGNTGQTSGNVGNESSIVRSVVTLIAIDYYYHYDSLEKENESAWK